MSPVSRLLALYKIYIIIIIIIIIIIGCTWYVRT